MSAVRRVTNDQGQPDGLVRGIELGEVGVLAGGPAGNVGEEEAVAPGGFGVLQEREEGAAFDLLLRNFCAGDVGEGGEDVEVGGDGGAELLDFTADEE